MVGRCVREQLGRHAEDTGVHDDLAGLRRARDEGSGSPGFEAVEFVLALGRGLHVRRHIASDLIDFVATQHIVEDDTAVALQGFGDALAR